MSNAIAVVEGVTMTWGYKPDGSNLAGAVVMFGRID